MDLLPPRRTRPKASVGFFFWIISQLSVREYALRLVLRLGPGPAHQKGVIFRTSIKYRESSAQASRLFLTPRLLVFS